MYNAGLYNLSDFLRILSAGNTKSSIENTLSVCQGGREMLTLNMIVFADGCHLKCLLADNRLLGQE